MELNPYRLMWLMVMFDLPTETKKDRFHYSKFKKKLEKDGFIMMQYSVYVRHCGSRENMDTHVKRVEKFLPPKGHVIIFWMTDKQYGEMKIFYGKSEMEAPESPKQLELF